MMCYETVTVTKVLQENARKQANRYSGPSVDADTSFYNEQKIETIKRKLAGDNPVLIMR